MGSAPQGDHQPGERARRSPPVVDIWRELIGFVAARLMKPSDVPAQSGKMCEQQKPALEDRMLRLHWAAIMARALDSIRL